MTLPWDKVDITAISVETEFYGEFEDKKQAIRQLLEQQGEQFEDKKQAIRQLLEQQGEQFEDMKQAICQVLQQQGE